MTSQYCNDLTIVLYLKTKPEQIKHAKQRRWNTYFYCRLGLQWKTACYVRTKRRDEGIKHYDRYWYRNIRGHFLINVSRRTIVNYLCPIACPFLSPLTATCHGLQFVFRLCIIFHVSIPCFHDL